ncbi:hypothetical protein OZX65_06630 [Leuconostocaceae bacterium ESL0723]|nr:hypothetical protein OZX65_06630 [Leuconostocaceae bacterium ESL0723]
MDNRQMSKEEMLSTIDVEMSYVGAYLSANSELKDLKEKANVISDDFDELAIERDNLVENINDIVNSINSNNSSLFVPEQSSKEEFLSFFK